MSAKQEFVATPEHHTVVFSTDGIKVDKGWCVTIYRWPDRFIAQTEYTKEDAARELARQLNEYFRRSGSDG